VLFIPTDPSATPSLFVRVEAEDANGARVEGNAPAGDVETALET
jgi:hypothetical protein